ncbi:MAG: hypothetical protein ACRDLB_00070 [Actinomycetota bacterium]
MARGTLPDGVDSPLGKDLKPMLTRTFAALRSNETVRKARVSIASLAVLTVVGAAAFIPAGPSLELTVAERHMGGPRQIVYGSVVDLAGEPVEGAVVKVWHERNGRNVRDMRVRTDVRGLYKKVLHERPGRYELRVRVGTGDDALKATRTITLRRGWAVEASAHMRDNGILRILPIFHY